MNRYYYHGIEFYPGAVGRAVKTMTKILEEGLINRNEVRDLQDSEMNHVCLYRKNEAYDYNNIETILHSARGGWIDGQFVFIVEPNIMAKKTEQETDLIDEWRSTGNILPTSFVGIALPFKTMQEYLDDKFGDEDDKKILRQYLPILIKKAESMGLAIVDSGEKDFTDKFDEEHSKTQSPGKKIS